VSLTSFLNGEIHDEFLKLIGVTSVFDHHRNKRQRCSPLGFQMQVCMHCFQMDVCINYNDIYIYLEKKMYVYIYTHNYVYLIAYFQPTPPTEHNPAE